MAQHSATIRYPTPSRTLGGDSPTLKYPHLVAPLLGRKLDITHSFYTPSPNVNTAKTHLPAHMQHLAQKHHLSAF